MNKVKGKCGLCLKNIKLIDSHLLPAAIYKIFSKESNEIRHPILVTDKKAISTSSQVSTLFLCECCDGRLSTLGEDHVLRKIYRGQQQFLIQTALKKVNTVVQNGHPIIFSVKDIPNIKFDHFVHFAAGVFWKASACSWPFLDKKLRSKQLGEKYEEQFRLYLLGKRLFPENVLLTMTVSNEINPFPSCIFPHAFKHDRIFQHRFYIPGIEFVLFVGKLLPKEQRLISISNTSDGQFLFDSLEKSPLIKGAKKSRMIVEPLGKLKKYVSDKIIV